MALAATLSAPAQQYTITDLGPIYISPYGARIGAYGLNNLGQVVGGAPVGGDCHAVLWQAGSTAPMDLGTLGGDSYALGINDPGRVVGRYGDPFDSGNTNAFLWDSGNGMRELLPLPDNSYGDAGSINSQGQAVGDSSNYSGDPYTHAVLWPAGSTTPIDLGVLPGETWSGADYVEGSINSYGQVVGSSGDPGTHAFLWTPFTPNGSTGAMIDLGSLGGAQASATGINASGVVIGNAQTSDGAWHAFMWTPLSPNGTSGTMTDLGTFGGTSTYTYGINDSNQFVGYGYAAGVEHAFIYSGNSLADLNNLIPAGSGWVLYRAFSINNRGQIAGYGTINGQIHSYLLTPASTIPPTTTITLSGSAGNNGWYRGPVQVTLAATDPAGPATTITTYFNIDEIGYTQYSGPFLVSGDNIHTLSVYSVDQFGNSETPHSQTIRIDSTPPVVTYSGNAGTYSVDQTVNITCTASDNLSGVASSTCEPITGPAYTFTIGVNTFSATATDVAGNVGSAMTSFTVKVTYIGLCNLTKQFVANDLAADLMCLTLDAAEAAQACGDSRLKSLSLELYQAEVRAAEQQKLVSSSNGATLIRLSGDL
jgi:probable HAF family extracellular repeat protein